MNKVAHYLQEHLVGEIFTSADVRKYFSTDSSILQIQPAIVVYPRNENDVRKAARFTWQLAERGRAVPITARGMGTDLGGASIGSGIMLVFPAHMHKILELDPKTGVVAIQPGTNFGKLQQTLHTHGRFLPPYPSSIEYTTIGGAVANNTSGEKSTKYGTMRDYVRGLRVVLSNGELIETGRLSKRELNRKMGLSSFEGEVYRALDTLIEENQSIIKNSKPANLAKNNAGYPLWEVKRKDGSFDLTPLIVGSQGTLGVVTETVLDTEPYNPEITLMSAQFNDRAAAFQSAKELKKLADQPSIIDFIDKRLLDHVRRINPNLLKDVPGELPEIVLFVEFDNESTRIQKRMAKKAKKIIEKHGGALTIAADEQGIDRIKSLRDCAATTILQPEGNNKALPVIDDAVVPTEKLAELMDRTDELMKRLGISVYAIRGRLGDGGLQVLPFLDIAQVGDRQRIFRLLDEYYSIVIELGGTVSGEHNDGRLHAILLGKQYSPEVLTLMQKTKIIFDPHNTLNPGVKFGSSVDALRPMVRSSYGVSQYVEHMPKV